MNAYNEHLTDCNFRYFLWRRSESIARPAFIRADEKGGNSVKSRTQKLQEQDGILLDGDEVESRMRQGR